MTNLLNRAGVINSSPLISFDTFIDEDLSLIAYIITDIRNEKVFNLDKVSNMSIEDIIKEISEDNDKIFVVINKNTEKFMNSKNKTDLIQCALEYNSYLIENLIKEKNNISELEYETALKRLYHNLSVLSESFELYENKFKLINNKESNNKKDNNDKKNKNNEDKNNIDDSIRVYSNSITNIEMELPL